MIKRHEIQASDDLVKYFNKICAALDNILAVTQSKDVFGNPLDDINVGTIEDPIIVSPDIDYLKNIIESEHTSGVVARNNAVSSFISGHSISISLDKYTDRTLARYETDRSNMVDKADQLSVAIVKVKNPNQLATEGSKISNVVVYGSPVAYETPYRYANIINDFCDASSYILKGINPDNGELFIGNIRQAILGLAQQLGIFNLGTWPDDIDDVPNMVSILNSVKADIDTVDYLELAKRIDDNVSKLPLIRRNWAIG